jgi:hypothetical protein
MKIELKNQGDMNYLQRCMEPTPKFFKKLRAIGLILAAAGGVLVAAPIALPAALVAAGGYLIVAGSVATAVSQAAVEDCGDKKKE